MLSPILGAQHNDAADWFMEIFRLKDFYLELFAILSYILWTKRNKAVFEGCVTDTRTIILASSNMLHDFINANGWPERNSPLLESRLWRKPPRNGWKIYFDGALSQFSAGGVGIYVESTTGEFFKGVSKFYHGLNTPLGVELVALRDALRIASNLGIVCASILGDSQQVILAAWGETEVPSLCKPILDEVGDLLQLSPLLRLFWVRRCNNLVAHEFVFHAKLNFDCNESWSTFPDHLFLLGLADSSTL